MVKIGDTVHYVSRGSADGKYPPVHVPFMVTNVHQMGRMGPDGAIPLLDGWTLNNRGQRFEEHVFGSYPGEENPGEWHPREDCDWTGWPEIPGLKEAIEAHKAEESV